MVAESILPHADFKQNGHLQDAPHFITTASFLSLFLAQRICADAETKANEKISSYEEQLSSLRERSQKILMDKDRFIQFTRQTFIRNHCF